MLGATAYASFVAVPVVPFQSSPSFYAGCNKRTGGAVKDAATFQSSPSFYAGCNNDGSQTQAQLQEFQSSPSFYAGCNQQSIFCVFRCTNVSILTQLLCWVQLTWFIFIPSNFLFQSSPSFYAGCNCGSSTQSKSLITFQSSPSFYAGCNSIWKSNSYGRCRFNPHPAFMLGATCAIYTIVMLR